MESGKQTVHVSVLEDSSVVQVVANGIRHVKAVTQTWLVEGKVSKACSNQRQVALAVTGGEVYYYELGLDGALAEVGKARLDGEVTAMDVGAIEVGRQRCRFLAVGLNDNTVRLLSLDPDSCLEMISMK